MDLNNEEPDSWMDRYKIDLIPKQLFIKFRKEVEGIRMGLNLEFYNAPINEFQTKLVLKPLSPDQRWKFIYEPLHHDIQLYSKKIPLTKFLNLQIGVAHSFQMHQFACKWKFSTCLGGDGFSLIRNKTSLDLYPGIGLRLGWKAEYDLPEVHGGIGTGESTFNMNSGRLNASLDRVEAILTHINFPAQKMDARKTDAQKLDAQKTDAQKLDANKKDAQKPDTD